MEPSEVIDRARILRLPDAKLYGEKNSLAEIFNQNPSLLEELRKQAIEQERWNLERRLWLIALLSGVAAVISALGAWAAVIYN